jgi:hypothetical protein
VKALGFTAWLEGDHARAVELAGDALSGSVAFADRTIEAGLTGEARRWSSPMVATPFGFRRVPVPVRRDRGGRPVVPAL